MGGGGGVGWGLVGGMGGGGGGGVWWEDERAVNVGGGSGEGHRVEDMGGGDLGGRQLGGVVVGGGGVRQAKEGRGVQVKFKGGGWEVCEQGQWGEGGDGGGIHVGVEHGIVMLESVVEWALGRWKGKGGAHKRGTGGGCFGAEEVRVGLIFSRAVGGHRGGRPLQVSVRYCLGGGYFGKGGGWKISPHGVAWGVYWL
uniref:Uncharacterized protein n=1 Tax=Knipowitschia caucasica TaxID=637954 RepID=A0AAV2LAF2_KNICA